MVQFTVGGNTKRSRFPAFAVEVPEPKAWPEASVAFILNYGLKQYLADGMAGATTGAEAKDGVEARIANVIAGEFKRAKGEAGERPDTVDTRATKLAKAWLREQAKEKGIKVDKDKIAEAAAKLLDLQPKWRKEAKKQLDSEAAAKAALAEEEDDDLLADLLGIAAGPDDEDEEPETEGEPAEPAPAE